METTAQDETSLTFGLSPDGVKLAATYRPVVGQSLDLAALRRGIATHGFGDFLLSEEALGMLVKKANATAFPFTLEIGQRRDACWELILSPDLMEARLTITPAYGGKAATVEAIRALLAERGVVYGINEENIALAAAARAPVELVLARGVAPQPGEDTKFESLIPEMQEQVPQVKDGETADYRNLGDIVSVSLGDPLIRRTPPTEGIPGRDVLGRELAAAAGREIPFADEMPGVACDLHDCDLIIAAISGYPTPLPNGAVVDPVFKVKRVDLSTGNLRFKGSLEIEGDVCEGMEVTATEGITVGGIVEAARLEAGGDIEVKGGVIGHGKLSLSGPESRHESAQLTAKGSVIVQFAENAHIAAGREILVKELAMQSELVSGTSIRVGEPGGRKGHLIGGLCRAATLVHAVVIGSHAGVPTVIEVGADPSLKQKLGFVSDALAEKGRLLEELAKTLSYVNERPGSMEPGLLKLKERVYAKYQGEIAELTGEKKRLQKRLEINAQAKVVVERQAFLGVLIRIGSSSLRIEEDLMGPTFTLGENGVCFES